MDRKRILIIIVSISISFLLIAGAPDASVTAAATDNQGSQSVTTRNNSDHQPEDVDKPKEKTSTTDPPKSNQTSDVSDSASSPPPSPPPPFSSPPPPLDNSAPPPPPENIDPKKSSDDTKEGKATSPPPPGDKKDNEKSGEKKVKDKSEKQTVITVFDPQENCSATSCKDKDKLFACIGKIKTGSKKLVVVVHNEGEVALDVNLSISLSVNNKPLKKVKLLQSQTEKINVPVAVGQNLKKLVLTAGHGECVLLLNPPSAIETTSYLRFPSYDKLVTPINGAYLLLLSVIIFGGIWACCIFRKRERRGGVDYQELEMAMPETVVGSDLETAEVWDDGWDDDWDGDNAVMSPGGHRVGSISANGLTSRTPVKDGWENGWDD